MGRRLPPLGKQLRGWRESRGMALRQLARRLGVSHVYLYEVETGRRRLSEKRLVHFAEMYGFNADELRALDGRIAPDIEEWLADNVAVVHELRRRMERSEGGRER
ncbi:MAG TPA: helix-turn-helix transcriptional regulator [Baekduia sp.]|nr:helix-turn-helix transcriptional regulator [Baekduia sp.]